MVYGQIKNCFRTGETRFNNYKTISLFFKGVRRKDAGKMRKKAGDGSVRRSGRGVVVREMRKNQLFAETMLQLTPAMAPSSPASAAAVSCVASSTTLMMLTPREWYGMPMRPTMNWL